MCHAPTLPLSLLPSFQVSFPLLTLLQSVAVKCRDESSLPTRVERQKVELASCLLCTCIYKAGGEYTFTVLMKLRCPQWLTGVLPYAPRVCHPGTELSVPLPAQGFAPGPCAGFPLMILACLPPRELRFKIYAMYNHENCCLSCLIDQ